MPATKTKTNAAKLAPRLKTLDGARLGLLSTGKKHCDSIVGAIGELLGERYGLASIQSWSKPSVYRFSPRKRMEEIKEQCDAVVAGVGD